MIISGWRSEKREGVKSLKGVKGAKREELWSGFAGDIMGSEKSSGK